MTDNTAELKLMRPPGPVAATCKNCPIFDRCGGIQNGRPLMNCFDQFCCGDGSCDNVCLHHPKFEERLIEIGGLRFDNLSPLKQTALHLPKYVPMIHHPYRRSKPLATPFVALDTYDLFRLKNGSYRTLADSPNAIRQHFRVAADSTVVLRGTAEDAELELYWSYRNVSRTAEQIASLGISLAIGPNFSTFLDVPRTDALYNRKRQLLCLGELSDAGVSVAPHLSATMPSDWSFWRDYLRDNSSLQHVALNCQTGYKNPTEGRKAIERIKAIQESIGRSLSLILIGGGQYAPRLAGSFDRYTVIDSSAFFKTVYRRRLTQPSDDRRSCDDTWTLERQPVDELLSHNVKAQLEWHESLSFSQQGNVTSE